MHQTRPSTEYAALLEAAPHAPIETSLEELLPLRDVLQDAIEQVLTPREQYIFNAVVIERLSLRAIAAQMSLSKSQVWRVHQGSLAKLREALQSHEEIRRHLT